MRRHAGSIALLAMTLSMFEGIAAGLCLEPMPGDVASEAAHAAMAHGASDTGDSGQHPRPDDGSTCPMSGAAPSQCVAMAIATTPTSSPQYLVRATRTLPTDADVTVSAQAEDLFHPPRA
jgi:hypothetical protein